MMASYGSNGTKQQPAGHGVKPPASGDTDWVPEAVALRMLQGVRSAIRKAGGIERWAAQNGIRTARKHGRLFLKAAELDGWKPVRPNVQTPTPTGESLTTGQLGALTAKLVELMAEELAPIRARLRNLENSVLLWADRVGRPSDPDEADYSDVTDIAKPHGWKPTVLNKALTRVGFQIDDRRADGTHDRYRLTDEGRKYGHAFGNHVARNGFQGRHIKWKPEVFDVVVDRLKAMDAGLTGPQ